MQNNNKIEFKSEPKVVTFLKGGAEIAGGSVAGALGFMAGGPAGAFLFGALGSIAALALRRVGEEISERVLGPRESIRVGALLALAGAEISSRVKQGELLRGDSFFDPMTGGRSEGEEVIESVLLKAQREAEEKKIAYMANLLSSFAFDSGVSGQFAHQLIKLSEQLTYRQLCILKLSVVKDGFNLRQTDYRGVTGFSREQLQILYECFELYHQGLINIGEGVMFGPSDVIPGKIMAQGLGAELYNLMKLVLIPEQDILSIAAQLH